MEEKSSFNICIQLFLEFGSFRSEKDTPTDEQCWNDCGLDNSVRVEGQYTLPDPWEGTLFLKEEDAPENREYVSFNATLSGETPGYFTGICDDKSQV